MMRLSHAAALIAGMLRKGLQLVTCKAERGMGSRMATVFRHEMEWHRRENGSMSGHN